MLVKGMLTTVAVESVGSVVYCCCTQVARYAAGVPELSFRCVLLILSLFQSFPT